MVDIAVFGVAHPHVEYVFDELALPAARGDKLIGIYDPSVKAAERYGLKFGAPTYTDAKALLEKKPDVAVIAGIYGDRGEIAVAALEAGVDVLADKPLCASLDELDRIEQAAVETGATVSVMLEKRGYPETIAAKEIVDSGELGEIVGITTSGPHKLKLSERPQWFLGRPGYPGVLADLSVHDVDAILYFTGAEEATVSAAQSGPLEGHPDFSLYGNALLTFPSLVATTEVSWLNPAAAAMHGDYQMRLVGTEGMAHIYWARNLVEVTTATTATRELELPEKIRPAEEALAAYRAGRPPAVSTAESIDATRLALLAQYSADHGGQTVSWQSSRIAREKDYRHTGASK